MTLDLYKTVSACIWLTMQQQLTSSCNNFNAKFKKQKQERGSGGKRKNGLTSHDKEPK
jgi:hypothetical protein